MHEPNPGRNMAAEIAAQPDVFADLLATRDTIAEVAARIESGTIWINGHGGVDPRIPFGGVKKSGYGLEFGVEGLKGLGLPQVISG